MKSETILEMCGSGSGVQVSLGSGHTLFSGLGEQGIRDEG